MCQKKKHAKSERASERERERRRDKESGLDASGGIEGRAIKPDDSRQLHETIDKCMCVGARSLACLCVCVSE